MGRFITSTNNHISRITSLMHKFTQKYSIPLLAFDDRVYHLFPLPHTLPTELEGELRLMGFGYRASFLESSLGTLRQEFGDAPGAIEAGLMGWRTGEVGQVREKLLGLKGVGRKVADCVMLMCLDRVCLYVYTWTNTNSSYP
jgi:N-glycosylase/DNA lyase